MGLVVVLRSKAKPRGFSSPTTTDITLLKSVMDGEDQPEETGRLLDELGSWYLEQAGEDPEG